MKAQERHKLKHDAAADNGARAMDWVSRNRQQVLIGVLAVLFLCAVAVWWTLSRQSADAAAQAEFAAVEKKAQMAFFLLDKTDEKQVRDVVATCEDIADRYPQTDIAARALLQAAHVLMLTGRAEEAPALCRRALQLGEDHPGLADLARRGLAEALETSGKNAEALAVYDELLSQSPSAEDAQTYWDLGRCEESLGRKDAAVSHYDRAVAVAPESGWAELARTALQRMRSVPAPAPEAPVSADSDAAVAAQEETS